jgi:signal transduction histidine kinase
VTDHAIGLAAQEQDRIFNRFERAVATRELGGFGLGLWIVVAAAGRLTVESQLAAARPSR